jgi:hypothetical protein
MQVHAPTKVTRPACRHVHIRRDVIEIVRQYNAFLLPARADKPI